MKIGNCEIKNNVFLAPMAGCADTAFRSICKELGCGLTYTEMVSADGIVNKRKNTVSLLTFAEQEIPVAVQIFGIDPGIMSKSCEVLNLRNDAKIIDINMGCSVRKVLKKGAGAGLMSNPELAEKIVREVKKVSIKPVTVKFRKGVNEKSVNAVDFAKRMEQSGADAITVHGRTREQRFKGKADWEIIKQVKQNVRIPVIGNGDVNTAEDVLKMLETTQCNAVMIGRGAIGNPWIFKQSLQLLNNQTIDYPKYDDRIEMYFRHLYLAIKFVGEKRAVLEIRKHTSGYLKGLTNAIEVKRKINIETDLGKIKSVLEDYKMGLKNS